MAQTKEDMALANALEDELNTGATPDKPLLAGNGGFAAFPVDKFVPAVIISYQVANLPIPQKYQKKGGPKERPSVRFMFAAHLRDDKGRPVYRELEDEQGNKREEPVILRKWTSWKTIGYGDNSGLRKLFKSVSNLENLMKADGTLPGKNGVKLGREDALWQTQFCIFCEWASAEKKYSNITKVKIDDESADKKSELDIDYSVDYVPYRTAPAFGNDVYLQSAVCKLPDHIHVYTQDDMVEPKKNEDK